MWIKQISHWCFYLTKNENNLWDTSWLSVGSRWNQYDSTEVWIAPRDSSGEDISMLHRISYYTQLQDYQRVVVFWRWDVHLHVSDHFTSEVISKSLYSGDNISIIATHITYYISILGPHLTKDMTELRVWSWDYGLHCGIEELPY
jgi:hypothetical protein